MKIPLARQSDNDLALHHVLNCDLVYPTDLNPSRPLIEEPTHCLIRAPSTRLVALRTVSVSPFIYTSLL